MGARSPRINVTDDEPEPRPAVVRRTGTKHVVYFPQVGLQGVVFIGGILTECPLQLACRSETM